VTFDPNGQGTRALNTLDPVRRVTTSVAEATDASDLRRSHDLIADEGKDDGPVPDAFVAVTVKVYVTPGGNPVNVAVVP
jgi:hypothetical protein